MAIETPSSQSFDLDGVTRVFPVASPIKGDSYCRIEVDNVYITDTSKYDIVNNSIVFLDAADVPDGSVLTVLVVQSDEAISQLGTTTNIDIVATNIDNVNAVGADISSVTALAPEISAISALGDNIVDIVALAPQADEINLVGTNIADVISVADNMAEVLLADTNAATATTKASEASASASSAATSASTATTQAGVATLNATSAADSASSAATSASNASSSASAASTSAGQASTSATQAASSASAASASAIAASASESASAASESAASTSATQAANSASAASTSASAASASATAAASSESTVAASASAAATSEANAATSEANAATSEANAESAYQSAILLFDNLGSNYLGEFATDPVDDGQGGPLVVGMSYYNTTIGELRFYAGTEWASPSASASAAADASAISATASAASATASANSATDSANSATESSGYATTSAASATESAGYASDSAASATESSGYASASAASATESAGYATDSANSATDSAGFATDSQNYLLAFEALYLGAKSSNPATDNEGNPLVAGAKYFNTVTNEMRVYNGSTWENTYANFGSLATVATTGSFNDLTDQPAPFDPNTLATVATTGAYSDLTGTPTAVSSFTNDSGYATTAYVDTSINSLDALPDQTGHAGQYLKTDGTSADWAALDIPDSYGIATATAENDVTAGDLMIANSDGTASAVKISSTYKDEVITKVDRITNNSTVRARVHFSDTTEGNFLVTWVESGNLKGCAGVISGDGLISWGSTYTIGGDTLNTSGNEKHQYDFAFGGLTSGSYSVGVLVYTAASGLSRCRMIYINGTTLTYGQVVTTTPPDSYEPRGQAVRIDPTDPTKAVNVIGTVRSSDNTRYVKATVLTLDTGIMRVSNVGTFYNLNSLSTNVFEDMEMAWLDNGYIVAPVNQQSIVTFSRSGDAITVHAQNDYLADIYINRLYAGMWNASRSNPNLFALTFASYNAGNYQSKVVFYTVNSSGVTFVDSYFSETTGGGSTMNPALAETGEAGKWILMTTNNTSYYPAVISINVDASGSITSTALSAVFSDTGGKYDCAVGFDWINPNYGILISSRNLMDIYTIDANGGYELSSNLTSTTQNYLVGVANNSCLAGQQVEVLTGNGGVIEVPNASFTPLGYVYAHQDNTIDSATNQSINMRIGRAITPTQFVTYIPYWSS